MKRGYTFTLVFMLIVAFAFATVLALANFFAQPAIAANRQAAEQQALLYAFDIPVDTNDRAAVEATVEKYVKEVETPDLTYYEYTDDSGQVAGYAVPYAGSGLWGAIEGYLAVTTDFEKLLGIVFTSQNETPGLGGRIDEEWFKDQFRGQSITSAVDYGEGIDAITGATSSSTAVIRIVNDTVADEIKALEAVLNG